MSLTMLLEENKARADKESKRKYENSSVDTGMFSREISRMREYDSEVCPQRLSPVLDYIKNNGLNGLEIIKRFGEREWSFPKEHLSLMANIINANEVLKRADAKYSFDFGLPIKRFNFDYEEIKKAQKSGQNSFESGWDSKTLFSLDDKISGYNYIFGFSDRIDNLMSIRETTIFGLAEETLKDKEEISVFELGKIDIKEMICGLKSRRFNYIFGTQPASQEEIKQGLISINKLPKEGTRINKDETVHYELKETSIDKVNPPRSARLSYDEAQEAVKQGLFSKIEVYRLIAKSIKIPKPDPVIVGVDHFNQSYPIVYWADERDGELK